MNKKLLSIILFTQLFSMVHAQKLVSPLFKNGDNVCFIGNSITNNGEFYNFIYLYYATRFPEEKLRFFNCGISGDVSAGVLKRMDSDILVHKPAWSVLMIGMNDVKRNLYTSSTSADPATEKLRQQALDKYKKDSESIVKILKQNSKVILQKPTIYDQTGALKAENNKGVNEALKLCGDHMQSLSSKYQTKLVDYWNIMSKTNKDLQEKDSTETVVGPDRVHPGVPGHFLMAYQFLKETGSPKYVSKIVIHSNAAQSKKESVNCEIQSQTVATDTISFKCLEYSLPFPVREDAEKALSWVPFNTELNNQILQINSVKSGKYRLTIDNQTVGDYTAESLRKGVNIATEKATPQYQQASKVMNLCMMYRKTEALLRNLKFVEIGHLGDLKNSTDTTEIKRFLDKRLENYKNGGHYNYYQNQFKTYLTSKSKQTTTEQRLLTIQSSIYRSNKPQSHDFKLFKIE